jgi:3-hydroxy-9,10-secoandrosta-1,3,5(10)-triene-9,17-dione monooxygenase reductase component
MEDGQHESCEAGAEPIAVGHGYYGAPVSSATATRALRKALGGFVTGITVVTACVPDGRTAGVTVNSFCSVSLDPPLVLWCLSRTAPSYPVFLDASYFAIHVLAEDQAHLSTRFSGQSKFGGRSKDKFAGLELSNGLGGAPILPDVVARYECRLERRYDGGDHLIMVGEVERYRHTDRLPLLFHAGRHRGLGRP